MQQVEPNRQGTEEKSSLETVLVSRCAVSVPIFNAYLIRLQHFFRTGSHSDVGGGYPEHDLADLSLVWMAVSVSIVTCHCAVDIFLSQAQIEDALGLDIEYLANLPRPVAPWGKQQPHK